MTRLTLIEKAFLLKKARPFKNLDLDLLLAIADKLFSSEYREGEHIFVLGEEATRMYFIAKGEVRILNSQKQEICSLHTAEYFGDEALFFDRPRKYYAFCSQSAHLLCLSRTHLHSIISECPSVALGFLEVYSEANPMRHLPRSETS